ncbi:Zn-dependent exopeptidase [Punctularia strigosozonata HHB-11173 SS5]|uniref:Zn-dependent exopeptidase n=1 Tax=Punctularia strigosozonata (strain HHB-11173) TaxID=741275 RepID=UPI00044179A2|nr:Zn-dependent exopeptidase [Punctularia strigosozonata HHB-11173 SS5]EIN12463.1 Zn-dependent exopeptidase [Punctularia strigosozonata HHB-11173 SS5]
MLPNRKSGWLISARPASLSRPLDEQTSTPRLLHSLEQKTNSILSLIADENYIYSGSQSSNISVWDKQTFTLKATLRGHTGSVLWLEYASDRKWLFSSSGDATIRVWCTRALVPLYVINPHLETDAGDLFSLAWSVYLQTLYVGCQNTSLQCISIAGSSGSGTSTPSRKAHKFFDSYPQYERRSADVYAMNGIAASLPLSSSEGCIQLSAPPVAKSVLQIPPSDVIESAHYGYIYCMALMPSTREGSDDHQHGMAREEELLVTGSGDESFKVWKITSEGPEHLHSYECAQGAVLSIVTRGDTIFAGLQGGSVVVWDLETKTLVRTVFVQENVDVLALSLLHSDLYTCSANGEVQRWSASFDRTASWNAHDGIILSSVIIQRHKSEDDGSGYALVTGANDGYIKVWHTEPPARFAVDANLNGACDDECPDTRTMNDTMVYALTKFISIASVSGKPSHKEDCRQAAIWLKKCLSQLGAESMLVPTGEDTNPLVLATFRGAQSEKRRPRVLFYGQVHLHSHLHYDVIPAPPRGWQYPPFELTPVNGRLYGRGVTDNKGPIMAVACAAAELLMKRELEVDLVMCVEGEEESGSRGFGEAVRRRRDVIGDVDAILISNSTWIAEDPPCITYGLRGVVHCSVEISSHSPDLHSGVDGGSVPEPMLDLVNLLATLIDRQRKVLVPKFYDSVRPPTEDETQLYRRISAIVQQPTSWLSSRWREPSLTVHNVEVSGPRNSTVIPSTVKAQVSVRIVPDQDLETIARSLCEHLETSFKELDSPNQLDVNITHKADWWLGNLDDRWFKALERSVRDEWGVEPLRIREGGSIPSVPWLEKEFGCHALHLPLGQSTDQAHLPNENISLSNLQRGKSVIERFLLAVASDE